MGAMVPPGVTMSGTLPLIQDKGFHNLVDLLYIVLHQAGRGCAAICRQAHDRVDGLGPKHFALARPIRSCLQPVSIRHSTHFSAMRSTGF